MNWPVNAVFVRVDTAVLVQNSHCWNSAETGIRGVGKTSRETASYSAAVKSNDRNQPLSLQVGVSKGNEDEQHALSALRSTRSRCCSPLPRAFPAKISFLDNGTCLPLRAAPPLGNVRTRSLKAKGRTSSCSRFLRSRGQTSLR